MRVLGEQGPVEIGPEGASLQATFRVVLAVVPEADAHAPKGPGLRTQVGAAAVVLETNEGGWPDVDQRGIDDHVSDEPALACLGADVDEADARKSLAVPGLVVMAEKLVAATHGEHAGARGDRPLERGLLEFEQILIDERLLPVLPAAEEEHVDLVHTPGRAPPGLDETSFEVAPLRALEQGEDVAPIAVHVHQVGVQPTDLERLPLPGHVPPQV